MQVFSGLAAVDPPAAAASAGLSSLAEPADRYKISDGRHFAGAIGAALAGVELARGEPVAQPGIDRHLPPHERDAPDKRGAGMDRPMLAPEVLRVAFLLTPLPLAAGSAGYAVSILPPVSQPGGLDRQSEMPGLPTPTPTPSPTSSPVATRPPALSSATEMGETPPPANGVGETLPAVAEPLSWRAAPESPALRSLPGHAAQSPSAAVPEGGQGGEGEAKVRQPTDAGRDSPGMASGSAEDPGLVAAAAPPERPEAMVPGPPAVYSRLNISVEVVLPLRKGEAPVSAIPRGAQGDPVPEAALVEPLAAVLPADLGSRPQADTGSGLAREFEPEGHVLVPPKDPQDSPPAAREVAPRDEPSLTATLAGVAPAETSAVPERVHTGSEPATVVVRWVEQASRRGRDGEREAVLRLDPPTLGEVRARLVDTLDGLRVELRAAREVGWQALHAAAPEMRSRLEAAGIPVRALDVRLDLASSGGHGGHQSLPDPPPVPRSTSFERSSVQTSRLRPGASDPHPGGLDARV
ncbi:MAG: flagellar hook-length control protein FliK [Armatimonadetes bacterium]|nr:flagellar hook-length control protein FliK [Armatimonadota bacterium]